MILKLLSPLDANLFVAMLLFEIVASVIFLHAELGTNYPRFTAWALFSTLKTYCLAFVPIKWYVSIFAGTNLVACLLLALAVAEVYAEILGPKESLPEWAPRDVFIVLTSSVFLAASLGLAFQANHGGPLVRIVMTSDAATVALIAIALWGLVIYSRRSGITWMSWPARIGAGLILWTTINTFTLFAVANASRHEAEVFRRIGQCAYLVSWGWWIVVLYSKEPIPEKADLERLAQLIEQDMPVVESFKNVS